MNEEKKLTSSLGARVAHIMSVTDGRVAKEWIFFFFFIVIFVRVADVYFNFFFLCGLIVSYATRLTNPSPLPNILNSI